MSASTDLSQECRIAEILQFSCEIEPIGNGSQQFHCFPLPRFFRLCRGHPAVEVTRLVNVDPSTGEVNVPSDVAQRLPKAKRWTDVICHQS
ncbi:hypothetical protein BGW80DRAFT_1171073 [Lactifluus volemus]|nr:hypothetical protein BGW80DRAFT_1171073 [Lactifluus volemus]